MQGCNSQHGRSGPGETDCLERQAQDPGPMGEWGISGGRPAYPGVLVYTVKSLAGGKTKLLHRNLLLPLQGKIRQGGEAGKEGVTDTEEEEEERALMPKVATVPKGSPRVTTKPQDSLTPAEPKCFFID